jgi:hypothetical protein
MRDKMAGNETQAQKDAAAKKAGNKLASIDSIAGGALGTKPQVNLEKGTKKSLSGLTSLPNITKTSQIKSGRPSNQPLTGTTTTTTQGGAVYYEGDGRNEYLTWSKQRAASVQLWLSSIPGLYPKGKEPRITDGVFNSYDFDALDKVMAYSDSRGIVSTDPDVPNWEKAINILYKNPTEAKAYFRVSEGSGPRKISTTPSGMAIADLDETYRTIFATNASDAEHTAYVKSLNALELKQGGSASAQQKEDLIFGLIEKTAKSKTSKVTDEADAATLNGIAGGLGAMVKQLRSAYENNGLAFTNTKLVSQAVKALRGQEEATNIFANIQGQAAQFYPAFAKQLESGQSVRDVLDPYISLASQVWEVPEDQIKLTDIPMDSEDPTKPPAIPAYKNALYSDARYLATQGYKDTQMNDLQSLIREAGLG